MCGRYVLVKVWFEGYFVTHRIWAGGEDFEDAPWFKKKLSEIRDRYDIRPTQDITLMRVENHDRRLAMPRAKWGWTVPWKRGPIFNARSESLLENKTWSKAIRERRCIIPASAFYEWQRRNDAPKPVPWEIKRAGAAGFFFAGVWKDAKDPRTGEAIIEASIITQAGNKLMRAVHNHGGNAGRQPVFLDDDKISRWLDPALQSPDEVMPLLRQIEDGEWEGEMLSAIGDDKAHTPAVPLQEDMFGSKPDKARKIKAKKH